MPPLCLVATTNRTPLQAGIGHGVEEDAWRLTVVGPHGTRELALADLMGRPQVTAELPVACVEGGSAGACWSGVRVAEVVGLVGGRDADVRVGSGRVGSGERSGVHRVTTLPARYAAHPDTLCVADQRCSLVRRPRLPRPRHRADRTGVLQTEWVRRLEVTA